MDCSTPTEGEVNYVAWLCCCECNDACALVLMPTTELQQHLQRVFCPSGKCIASFSLLQ